MVSGDQMEQNNFEDYLKSRYWDQIKYYEEKAGQNQKIYRYLQWALIILAAYAYPVSSGIAFSFSAFG
jgi:hypothetical protein